MTWLAWRQQRTELLIAAGFLGLLLLIFIPTGIQMANRFDDDGIAGCLAAPTADCAATIDAFEDAFAAVSGVTTWFGLVPILVGVLFAAPLVLELERGPTGWPGPKASRASAGSSPSCWSSPPARCSSRSPSHCCSPGGRDRSTGSTGASIPAPSRSKAPRRWRTDCSRPR